MTNASTVTPSAIAATYERIKPHVRQTPILAVGAQDFGLAGGALSLKLELTQHSGSFKARGAFANSRTVVGDGAAEELSLLFEMDADDHLAAFTARKRPVLHGILDQRLEQEARYM